MDGIPYNGDPKLSNSEIETIDVLKDAASAAIYGTRGSGGVILITTKQGKAGTMKVGIDSYYGVQQITSGVALTKRQLPNIWCILPSLFMILIPLDH